VTDERLSSQKQMLHPRAGSGLLSDRLEPLIAVRAVSSLIETLKSKFSILISGRLSLI